MMEGQAASKASTRTLLHYTGRQHQTVCVCGCVCVCVCVWVCVTGCKSDFEDHYKLLNGCFSLFYL